MTTTATLILRSKTRIAHLLIVGLAWSWPTLNAQIPEALQSQIRQEMNKAAEGQPKPETRVDLEEDRSTQTVISRPPREVLRPEATSAYQEYVNREASRLGLSAKLRPFAASLVRNEEQSFSPASNYAVPDDYRLAPGDEILLRVWGTYETDRLLRVDRRGYIKPPVVPEIKVAGLRYGDLNPIIRKSFAKDLRGL